MSGIGGILMLDKSPPQARDLQYIVSGIARRARTAARLFSQEFFAGLYASSLVPSTAQGQQPYVADGCVLLFDGRLDNRRALQSALPDTSQGPHGQSDVCYVYHAYRKWGVAFADHLCGDFAVVLWDASSRTLYAARDTFGVVPIFYVHSSRMFAWASCAEALLPLVSGKINSSFLAQYITSEPSPELSPFEQIAAVEPGATLSCKQETGELRITRSTWIENLSGEKVRKVSDREAEEEYRVLFRDAIATRMQDNSRALVLLSGGLDSSSVVCVGKQLNPDGLYTASFVFDKARQSDERGYIRAVEEHIGRSGLHLLEDECPILSMNPDSQFVSVPSPILCFGGRIAQVNTAMDAVEADVLLTGTYGDHVHFSDGNEDYVLAQYLRNGNVGTFLLDTYRWASTRKRSVLPLATSAIKKAMRENLRELQAPLWLHPELRLSLKHETTRHSGLSERTAPISMAIRNVAGGHATYQNTKRFFETRYPYLHRPFVEFLLRLPADQFHRPGDNRSLHRRAMGAILPEAIRTRKTKAGPAEALHLAFRRSPEFFNSLVREPRSVDFGLVVGEKIAAECKSVRHGQVTNLAQFLRFLSVEIWLRNLDLYAEPHGVRQPIATLSHAESR